MLSIKSSPKQQLPDLAACQMACFPTSFATKLGKPYIQKSLEWFLENEQRFLFHCEEDEKVVGYCGGFAPAFYGDGSSSGMLQHAFKQAVKGTLKKPWLIFHPEIFQYYPHVFRNIRKKILKQKSTSATTQITKEFDKLVGLVIIGVHPEYRGKGVFELLMVEFEKQAGLLHRNEVNLSVKKENLRAINAYKKLGWKVKHEKPDGLKMHKFL
jgi:ribosomal protein S18 acetylase RimI-like enzyme